MRVAINGLGRIGKQFLLAAIEQGVNWDFVINDVADDDFLAYTLKYDTVHSVLNAGISCKNSTLFIGKRRIPVHHQTDPTLLPWKSECIDLVVECSGFFTKRQQAKKHLDAGAGKILISAPAEASDCTVIYGVNDSILNQKSRIVSAGSCTTNCVTTLLHILHSELTIESAFFITAHAYTSTQKLIDGFDPKDRRRGRSAANNIVPTTSGAATSVVEALPELKGKLDGYALRVPVSDGSIVSVVALVQKASTCDQLNALFKKKAGESRKVLSYTEDPIVSSDIIHDSHSCIFDASFTQVIKKHVSLAGWYDNEWGYANRLVDVARLMLSL